MNEFTTKDIEKYFNAEKSESLFFIFFAIVAIATAVYFFFFLQHNFFKGASVPLLCIALLLGIVGYNIYAKSDTDRINNVYAFGMNPSQIKEQEIPRMKVVMKKFELYRYTEIILAIIGIVLFLLFKYLTANNFWSGFGAALFFMAVVALCADYFAEKRGEIYLTKMTNYYESH
jgi:ABC-type xylose transport system permease subunit